MWDLENCTYHSADDSVHHDAFWEIHGVRYGNHDELGVGPGWPIKDAVQNSLLTGPQEVQLKQNITGLLFKCWLDTGLILKMCSKTNVNL